MRELDDDTAYMMLATCNAQGEQSALERGMHALHSVPEAEKLDVKAYAASAGREKELQTVHREVWAAKVACSDNHMVIADLSGHVRHLAEIYPARPYLWPPLVKAMLDAKPKAWTVEHTREAVAKA